MQITTALRAGVGLALFCSCLLRPTAAVPDPSTYLPGQLLVKFKPAPSGVADEHRGHWNDYGVIGNSKSLGQYRTESCRALFKWLNRRSQKRSYTWRAFNRLLQRFAVPVPRIVEGEKEKLGLKDKPGWNVQQARGMNLLGAHYVASRA